MIITIDGPAGSGKSSTAREAAGRLGFLHLDSGALYRAFAYAACERGWADSEGELPAERAADLAQAEITAEGTVEGIVARLGSRTLEQELRSQRVTKCASLVSAYPEVRRRVNDLLRTVAEKHPGGVVVEGRDMGTVVFPEADLKIYMTASPEARSRRRLEQQGRAVTPRELRAEADRLVARDTADSERSVSPLRRAAGAYEIDTTALAFEEQVERIVEMAKRLDTT